LSAHWATTLVGPLPSCSTSSPGSGLPNSIPNSGRWDSAQLRNAWQAAIILAVMSPPLSWAARSIAAWMSAAISVKMSPHTCWSRSSRLPK
jgi:hypothetical protein